MSDHQSQTEVSRTDKEMDCRDVSTTGASKKRTVITPSQKRILERKFQESRYIKTCDLEQLSHDLKLSPQAIQTWFKNRRYNWKKMMVAALWHPHQAPAYQGESLAIQPDYRFHGRNRAGRVLTHPLPSIPNYRSYHPYGGYSYNSPYEYHGMVNYDQSSTYYDSYSSLSHGQYSNEPATYREARDTHQVYGIRDPRYFGTRDQDF